VVVVAADLVVVAMFFLFVGVVVLLAAEPALGAWILVHNLNIRHQRNATGSKIHLAVEAPSSSDPYDCITYCLIPLLDACQSEGSNAQKQGTSEAIKTRKKNIFVGLRNLKKQEPFNAAIHRHVPLTDSI